VRRVLAVVAAVGLLELISLIPASAVSGLDVRFRVPDYTVTRTGSYDYVEIPGGGILLEEEGRPRVPYYTYSLDLEQGWRAQEVTLVEKSQPVIRQGLVLPPVMLQWTLAAPVAAIPGFYPDIEFEWNLLNRPDGSQSVDIVVYPVRYNPETAELQFCGEYAFRVDYVTTAAELSGLILDKPVYAPGEMVNLQVALTSSGAGQDLYLDIFIRQYGSDRLIDSLPVRLLKDATGPSSASAAWDSTGNDEGGYYSEAVLSDNSGNILDTARAGFALDSSGDLLPTTQPAPTTPAATTTPAPGPLPTPQPSGFLDWVKNNLAWVGIGAGVVLLLVVIMSVIKRRSGK